jgi:hypothetical protein
MWRGREAVCGRDKLRVPVRRGGGTRAGGSETPQAFAEPSGRFTCASGQPRPGLSLGNVLYAVHIVGTTVTVQYIRYIPTVLCTVRHMYGTGRDPTHLTLAPGSTYSIYLFHTGTAGGGFLADFPLPRRRTSQRRSLDLGRHSEFHTKPQHITTPPSKRKHP